MAAAEILVPNIAAPKAAPVESFEGRHERTSKRLTEFEAADLRYLWDGYESDLGIRSLHGSIEFRMLMSAPRDVRAAVVEELERHGGRAAEGLVLRVLAAEGTATRAETRRALRMLERTGRVERVAVERPERPTMCSLPRRACDHACSHCMWTGWDLRLRERGEVRISLALRAVPKTPEQRWAERDERLRAQLHTIEPSAGAGTHAASVEREPLPAYKRAAVNRALTALAKLSTLEAAALRCLYGDTHYPTEQSELRALRAATGVPTDARARELRDRACEAYRAASR